ncbi:MAG: hypothetical protein H8D56_22060 [Planctomycetes bacterium]|nr:hypothetical protein [Planctomycetota bacterium]MBL7143415.1 hypothetical protein [Phycisphaerae bacterium]
MLKAGAIILSIGAGLQCIVSILSLIISIAGNAPMLQMVFTDNEISALDAKVVETTKSLAILHNSGAVLVTLLFLIIIWTSLVSGHKWAFWTLLFAGVWGHVFWFISDRFIGNETLIVNIVFAAIFSAGISLAGYGIFK